MPKGKVIEVRPKKRKHSQRLDETQPQATGNSANNGAQQSLRPTMDRMRFNKARSRSHSDKHHFEFPISGKLQRYIFSGGLISVFVAICIGYGLRGYNQWRMATMVRNPSNLPKIIQSDLSTDRLFWGTYRPGLYFGLKHRSPNPLLVGIIWASQDGGNPKFRHFCDPYDGVVSYNWVEHDGEHFGVQQIVDVNHIITVSFIKRSLRGNEGDWSLRVAAVSRNQTSVSVPLSVTVYFYYMGDNGNYYFQPMINKDTVYGIEGSMADLGEHKIFFHNSRDAIQTSSLVANIPREDAIMETFYSGLGYRRDTQMFVLTGRVPQRDQNVQPNVWFQEVTVIPSARAPSSTPDDMVFEIEFDRNSDRFSGKQFDDQLAVLSKSFHEWFESRFQVDMKRFTERQVNLSKIAVSNLLGGIGYFHGRSLIQSVHTGPEPIESWPASLFTATPSRPMFPRGFLWDEGFHGLILAQWKPQLAMESVGHWLDLMNGEGWIPREQILGHEARSRVPAQFVVQHNMVANPPSLILVIEALIDSLPKFTAEETTNFRQWSTLVLPRLHTWFQWFNRTQTGPVPLSYRWHGRDPQAIHQLNPLTLSSGLDDYPRASHPSDLERHLDLRCWMTVFARVVSRLASLVAQYAQTETNSSRLQRLEEARSLASQYGRYADILADMNNLDQLHWSETAGRYADFGLHTDAVRLQLPEMDPQQASQNAESVKPIRVTDNSPSLQLVTSSYGYVNLFPLFLRLIPPSSSRLPRLLADLNKPEIWTDYGLRSLSTDSPMYQQSNTKEDPPYWRGAIWINMNFLAVRSLRYYATHPKTPPETARQADQLYKKLSDNVVRNVLGELERTGFLWEQYNDVTGRGQRGHPFSGWTSLVSLMMS